MFRGNNSEMVAAMLPLVFIINQLKTMIQTIIASIVAAVIITLMAAYAYHQYQMGKRKKKFWSFMLAKAKYKTEDFEQMLLKLNDPYGGACQEIFNCGPNHIMGEAYERYTAIKYNAAFTDAIKRMSAAYASDDLKMFNIYYRLACENYEALENLKEEISVAYA